MSLRSGVWLAVLAAAVAAGCRDDVRTTTVRDDVRTTTVEVSAVAHDGGARVEILKDLEHHDSAVVWPGDRIEFVCRDCPPGAEFAVEEIHFVGDLDVLADVMLRHGLTDPRQLDALIDEAARATAAPSGAEGGSPEAGGVSVDGKGAADSAAVLRDLRSAFALPSQDGQQGSSLLFADWSPPRGFASAREAIVSGPVGPITHAGLWKFTWRVRLPGGAEDVWDPHIYGHPERDR